jgi:hypothetical protein
VILIGSFALEIEVDSTVGIAVEDGHPANASLRHMCGKPATTARAIRALDLILAPPFTESQNCI